MITFIGDVHGWLDRLEAILGFEPEGPYVFVGDLIDRGPDSRGVVRRVRELCEGGRAQCVMGNHEFALVRGLGCAALGYRPCPDFYRAWLGVYGAAETLQSYGLSDADPDRLRSAMGDDLDFLASLPWVLEGQTEGQRWLAVHAGLQADRPWVEQVQILRQPRQWFDDFQAHHPPALYDKRLVDVVPDDLPPDVTVVSGHTPQVRIRQFPGRIVCDTSGGRVGRKLSAIRWPARQVFQAD